MFTWSVAGVALETLTSKDKLKLGGKVLHVYRILTKHIARDNSWFFKEEKCQLFLEMDFVGDIRYYSRHSIKVRRELNHWRRESRPSS